MRVLVTGGCGFIGHHFVDFATNHSSKIYKKVLNLDNLSYASINCPNGDFILGDICDEGLLYKVLREHKIDTLVHFAAQTHVDRSIQNPTPFVTDNIQGTISLLTCCTEYIKETGVNFKFVYISTDEVYGSIAPNTSPLSETQPLHPRNPYAVSKASAELFVQAWVNTFAFPAVITRSSNNYGTGQHTEKFIPKIIDRALKWSYIPIYGNGHASREWLHVLDNCEAIHGLLTSDIKFKGQVFNITSSDSYTNIDLANMVCEKLDELKPHSKGSYKQLIEFVDDRPGHDMRYAIDSSKIKSTLSWTPTRLIADHINELVEGASPEVLPHTEKAHLLHFPKYTDTRGSVSPRELHALHNQTGTNFVQENFTKSVLGTLRGLHFQRERPQAKLIQVLEGKILDVVVDLRPHSDEFGTWKSFKLKQGDSLFVPAGYAHGYLTLSESSYVLYKLSDFYDPKDQYSIRYDDQYLNIDWGGEISADDYVLSPKDRQGMTWSEFLNSI
ncbi:GDP-mannose 4,6-dehydratase [Taylorella equigenitalis]|uniref:GDP-mannose 4,6-dehydratase n=1 Tax=Taylorella equigenitalis TaxID=29575 RepID=UPI00237D1E16|nr:GDP-mannose 4,6-dehydratase [Taylorella equigenitalis]WDU54903.1 GDP-mannose 4,6-dehydratase [Taylorella equigenitalis]